MRDRRLGPYELLDVVGRGGFAVVWLARRVDGRPPRELVALKTVHSEATVDAKLENMLVTEACVASRVNHPNVARVYELGDFQGVLYLVMEYVDGASLSALASDFREDERKFPLAAALAVVTQVCAGLHAAHELRDGGELVGVIHRDVSPQNILVSRNGEVKLVDFGIAKARAYSMSETTAGIAKGKRHYMAPEQVMAQALDRRVDVWAAAAVAYELIEGRPVHDGPNEMARLHSLIHSETASPLGSEVPIEIANVLRRALSRDPDRRHATAAELCDDLHAAAARADVSTGDVDLAGLVRSHDGRSTQKTRTSVLRDAEVPRARRRGRAGATVLFTAPLARERPPPHSTPSGSPHRPILLAPDSGSASPPVETNAQPRASTRSWPLAMAAIAGIALAALVAPLVRRTPQATAPPATTPARPASGAALSEADPAQDGLGASGSAISTPSATPPPLPADATSAQATKSVPPTVAPPKKRATGRAHHRTPTSSSDLVDDRIE